MAGSLFHQIKRAETQLEKAFSGSPSREEFTNSRRRLRLDLLRRHVSSGVLSLKARHAEGASGSESVQAHAAFVDQCLQALFHLAVEDAKRERLIPHSTVLVALGGYGRGELHPSSDIDLMVIYEGELSPWVQRLTQEILYTLWDLGLQVGHSCRSLEDCLAIARTDFPSRTSMQEARWVAGDRRLFQRFQKTLRENIYRKDFSQFLETTLAERDQRYRKFGSSPYIGEPNIKESAGGLRDLHTAMWLVSTKFGARTLAELVDKGLITKEERTSVDEALTFLWRVRNELHFISGHKNDVLSRDLQIEIARNFGYTDGEHALGVEQFMRDYYLHARRIHRISSRLITRCQENLSRRGFLVRRMRQEAMADGFVFYDGRLHLADPDRRAFEEDPVRLMKVFWHAHQQGSDLGVDLERAIESSLDMLDDTVRNSDTVRDLFFSILRNWGRVATTLRLMHELGLLGRYLPEFGGLTCLVQFDAYHKYTADQHSLLAVENLEGLAPGGTAESEGMAALVAELERPEIMVLGMLLHDIGKSRGHGHVEKGAAMIRETTTRLKLPPEDARALEFLVEQHLLMSHVAQRRDLDDPKTIERLAHAVGNSQWLRMLYLLTYADTKAVGPGVMTGWRASILWELFSRTLAHLEGGRPESPDRASLTLKLWEALDGELTRAVVAAHVTGLTDRYLSTNSVQRMASHLRVIQRLESEPFATECFHHPDLGYSDLVVVTRDHPGLFSLIAGTLAANGINILSAQIYTRADGIALDTFQVNDAHGEAVMDEFRWSRFHEDLSRVIERSLSVEELLSLRQSRRPSEAVRAAAKVAMDPHLSDHYTVIEVKCPDRLGVLYRITHTLAQEGLSIASAKITTEIDHAFDVFYVTDLSGRKIESEAALERIREALETALSR
jgi:[protein-PII] uridylyltransferase